MFRFPSGASPSKTVIVAAGTLVVLLLGVVDFLTGPELSFSVFYLLPITLVTWLTDRKGGITVASLSTITWLGADLFNSTPYSHPLIPYWNAVVRLVMFLIVVYLESALKELNQGLEKRVKERTALLQEEVSERKKVESRLQGYANRLEILHEIDQAILAVASLEAIAHTTIQAVQNLLHCDFVSFILVDFEARQFVLFESHGEQQQAKFLEKRVAMDAIPEHRRIVELLRQGVAPVGEERVNPPLNALLFQILGAHEYHSLLIVPVFVQNELIGSLNLLSYRQNAFTSEHREIGREIANQLGIAIHQARMLNQMRTDQRNLQMLSQRLLDVQESERREIARELHDEIGQALTSIGLTLEMLTHLQAEALPGALKQSQALVYELMERVSRLSLELRPALLDDLGLLPALLWHFDRYTAQTNIQVIFKHSGLEEKRFAPAIETAAYRIVQEALTNVARHARVSQTRVTIWYDQHTLGLQVEDEGQGFDANRVLAHRDSSGLLGMRERAVLLNGEFTIETAQGAGTRLLAEIPTMKPGEGQV